MSSLELRLWLYKQPVFLTLHDKPELIPFSVSGPNERIELMSPWGQDHLGRIACPVKISAPRHYTF